MPESSDLYRTRPGTRVPPGARLHADGVNFCIAGREATAVWLVLYATADSLEPCQVIDLDPVENHSGFFWHIFVEGLKVGSCYTWRMRGPTDTAATGRRFDERVELLDPWALAVSDRLWDRAAAHDLGNPSPRRLRGVVAPTPLSRPQSQVRGLERAVIYELHVGGFTRHPSAGVAAPGTFAGLMEKIPYLRELGITHVELMPVMAFDSQDVPLQVAARGLRNFWGYSTYGFLAPHPGYCLDQAQAPFEFRALVDALHTAGIGVILDVVFNHTAEGDEDGPVINFKGIANDVFYHLDSADPRRYLDFTGCGNTLNCNHPLVAAFILHSLEYWAGQLGVDGFRFDLASVLVRGPGGVPLENPPLPWMIEFSSVLSDRCLIAEAWDAGGLYHVGAFPGMDWSEWNGHYRDVMRRFVRGEPGLVGLVATKLSGSADLYANDGRRPANSVNFITCHDGFTLHDLVSYTRKHNADNGEDNRDGSEENFSSNGGVEGATEDPAVLALRHRQAKNLLALLLLSRGTPMILSGDEVLRSQQGNNNAWCQDNATGWFDWELVECNSDFLRFTRALIALRRRHACLTANRFFTGAVPAGRTRPDITWHGAQLNKPQWSNPEARVLACTISAVAPDEEDLHLVLNMADEPLEAPLPTLDRGCWHLALDTARPSPQDIQPASMQQPLEGRTYTVAPHSVVLLETR